MESIVKKSKANYIGQSLNLRLGFGWFTESRPVKEIGEKKA